MRLSDLGIEVKYTLGDGQLQCHCPFHEDKKPSFCYHPQKKVFICFSCGRTGSLRQLAKLLGREKKKLDIEYQPIQNQIQILKKLCFSLIYDAAIRSKNSENQDSIYDHLDRISCMMPESLEDLKKFKKELIEFLNAC